MVNHTTVPGTASSQRSFSSKRSDRMFSLTPVIHIKSARKSSKESRTPQVTRPTDKIGYKESSLSQREVLLAKGGSQKLSELLADDQLWVDDLCS